MRKYRIKTEVPWNDVLYVLRWHLNMRITQCLYHNEWTDDMRKISMQDLKESLHCYTSVRHFLGYRVSTKLEQRAAETLQRMAQEH